MKDYKTGDIVGNSCTTKGGESYVYKKKKPHERQASRAEIQADKVAAAKDRDTERATRTASEQIKLLDSRLGKGVGAKRERARLQTMIEKDSIDPALVKTPESPVVKMKKKDKTK